MSSTTNNELQLEHLIAIFLGGGLGSILRYVISLKLNLPHHYMPFGTLAINAFAGFLIGIFASFFDALPRLGYDIDGPFLRVLTITGFCGGFSTFSAFSLENYQMMKQGEVIRPIIYTLSSVIASIFLVIVSYQLTSLIISKNIEFIPLPSANIDQNA